jgi:hypothetical protein
MKTVVLHWEKAKSKLISIWEFPHRGLKNSLIVFTPEMQFQIINYKIFVNWLFGNIARKTAIY